MPFETLVEDIYQIYKRGNAGDQRGHLGASSIGDPCARRLWYGFRWASPPNFTGRQYRMFNRGIREEPILVSELRAVGYKVSETNEAGDQHNFKSLGGHFAGSADCIITDTDGDRFVGEFKTAGKVSFNKLEKHGIEHAQPLHVAQLQTYMARFKINHGLYLAVCKDDDRIYCEYLPADPDFAAELLDKAEYIIEAETPPARVSQDPAFFLCKLCPHSGPCFELSPLAPSCRTCRHSQPIPGSLWSCTNSQLHQDPQPLSLEEQRKGCLSFQPIGS